VGVSSLKRLEPRQLAFDVAVALAVLALALMSRPLDIEGLNDVFVRDPDWLHTTLILLMAVPLVLRRVYPRAVFSIVLGAWVIDRTLDYPEIVASVGVIIAFYTIGTELSRRRSYLVGGLTAVFLLFWTALGAFLLESVTMVSIASTIIATATPLLVGREMRARRERAEELQRKVAEAERERKESARRAVAEERARIARELHDVVAHQMTVMTIQADGARRVADGADPRVIEALDTIQATGHSALAEMRRVVGLLRENETGSPELAPLPTLDDLGTLVEQVRSSTGVPVDLEVEGAVRPLAEGVELSAYRIVQESLTNAVRHGGPNVSADVAVCYGDDGLDVLVVDNGRGAAAAAGNGGGHGLVGMRERVAVLGGSFEAGPRPGGGYRVHASIPYQT
jgi:signal transduction histidine kinase